MSVFQVITDHPVAVDSADHKFPAGTMHDNSRNRNFNRKLYEKFPGKLTLCDFGCSGGGFVRDCIEDGHEAIGLEGSDYSIIWDFAGGTKAEQAKRKPGRRAEWATIPDNLFTCDITKPFTVLKDGEPCQFDIITAWEVMEHISEADLPGLCENVRNHLKANGLWIMSVSTQNDGPHHVTVKRKDWWVNKFTEYGWENRSDLVAYFKDDWIRGPQQNAPESFHLILEKRS